MIYFWRGGLFWRRLSLQQKSEERGKKVRGKERN
jgi:hypothetical protein